MSLRNPAEPYPVDLHIANGNTNVALIGTIEQPMSFGGARLKLTLAGQDMSNLYQLTNIPLPQHAALQHHRQSRLYQRNHPVR